MFHWVWDIGISEFRPLFVGFDRGIWGLCVAICVYGCCIERLFTMWVSLFSCSYVPMLLFWWCVQSSCSVESSFLGMLSSGGIVGSSYVIV